MKTHKPPKKPQKPKAPKKPAPERTHTPNLEDGLEQVTERFQRGCECQDDRCFKDLNPDLVYRHRLNIADLTKEEHDMYLMGMFMACLTNPHETKRQRVRANYSYQGRRVCLDAFLYLENCTYYQIKRIRKHLVTHGVTPRVHGNHGKVPHNTFSLDIYQIATEFLKDFVKEQETKMKTKAAKNAPVHLPPDVSRKVIYGWYTGFCKAKSPDIKIMGYPTFRRFLKVQFPQLRFAKTEFIKTKVETSEARKVLAFGEEELGPIIIAEPRQTYLVTKLDRDDLAGNVFVECDVLAIETE